MTEKKVPRSVRSQRIYFTACLIGWAALLPLSAWLGLQKDNYADSLFTGPVNALAGALSGVVIGALLVQRWQKRIQEEDREDWLLRNKDYILKAHDAMRNLTSDLFLAAYRPFETVLGTEHIPEEILCAYATRKPRLPRMGEEDVFMVGKRSLADFHRISEGPLRTAAYQLTELSTRLGTILPQSADTSFAADQPMPVSDIAELLVTAFTDEVAARLERLADHVLLLTPDMTGVKDFEPSEVRAPVIDLIAAVREIGTTVEGARAAPNKDLKAIKLLGNASEILSTSLQLQEALWSSSKNLMLKVYQLRGLTAVGDDRIANRNADTMDGFNDLLWQEWRKDHDRPIDEEDLA